jgi:hypothetical protein
LLDLPIGDSKGLVHAPPVRGEGAPEDLQVERQPELAAYRGVGLEQSRNRIDDRSVPIEEDGSPRHHQAAHRLKFMRFRYIQIAATVEYLSRTSWPGRGSFTLGTAYCHCPDLPSVGYLPLAQIERMVDFET